MASDFPRNESDNEQDRASLGDSLRRTMRELVQARAPDDDLAAARRALRVWQNKRFATTYSDLAAQPRYAAAVDFFLTELYGDADMTARDEDLISVLPVMVKLLPAAALETIRDALAFEVLCERLDTDVARNLASTRLDVESYGKAFRECGQPALRRRQIEYVTQIGQALDRLTRWPMITATLRLMRKPAASAGLSALQEFLERGFTAFKQMHGATDFLATIVRRETAIVDRLFAAHPRPFELEDGS
jgi:hypothetical protein